MAMFIHAGNNIFPNGSVPHLCMGMPAPALLALQTLIWCTIYCEIEMSMPFRFLRFTVHLNLIQYSYSSSVRLERKLTHVFGRTDNQCSSNILKVSPFRNWRSFTRTHHCSALSDISIYLHIFHSLRFPPVCPLLKQAFNFTAQRTEFYYALRIFGKINFESHGGAGDAGKKGNRSERTADERNWNFSRIFGVFVCYTYFLQLFCGPTLRLFTLFVLLFLSLEISRTDKYAEWIHYPLTMWEYHVECHGIYLIRSIVCVATLVRSLVRLLANTKSIEPIAEMTQVATTKGFRLHDYNTTLIEHPHTNFFAPVFRSTSRSSRLARSPAFPFSFFYRIFPLLYRHSVCANSSFGQWFLVCIVFGCSLDSFPSAARAELHENYQNMQFLFFVLEHGH